MNSDKFTKLKESTNDIHIYHINEKIQLLSFLREAMPHRSRNSVKSILSRGQVKVDQKIVTQFNYLLRPEQTVEIIKNKAAIRESVMIGVEVLYEDNDLIIIQKDAGLLSVASDKEKVLTAHTQLMEYVRTAHINNKVYVVHRLDKDTSGVMMFAKNEQTKKQLQRNWRSAVKERLYVALVEGDVEKSEGTITSWLQETKTRIVYSSDKRNDGLRAVTHFKKIQSNEGYSLMEVLLETGRKNQIRVHMKDIGHSVVGDKKYGSNKDPIRRLGLHAKALTFIHPRTKKQLRFESKVPNAFFKVSK